MREAKGDLWSYPADATVITTNGSIKKDGTCVMGRGVAAQAKKRWPELPRILGVLLKTHGNIPFIIDLGELNPGGSGWLLTFPVKHFWHERADPHLIQKTAIEMTRMIKEIPWKTIALPRPGCGNGQLSWNVVKPILEPILDDRFMVVNNER